MMQEVDTYTGDTSEARFMTNASPATSERRKLPELDLATAYKTLNFYQDKPQYLANPFTSKVANAHFAQAAKIVSMNIQLERLNNSTKMADAQIQQDRGDIKSFLTLSPFLTPEELGSITDDEGRFALTKDSRMNLRRLQGVYADKINLQTRQAEIGGTKGWIDIRGNFHPDPIAVGEARHAATLEAIDTRFQNQLALIDPKNEAAIKTLQEKHRLARELFIEQLPQKTAAAEHLIGVRSAAAIELAGTREQNAEKLSRFKKEIGTDKPDRPVLVTEVDPVTGTKISRRMTVADAEKLPAVSDEKTHKLLSQYAEQKAAIESGDLSAGPDWMHLSNRAKTLAELKTKIEQKGINPDTGRKIGSPETSPAAPAAAPSTNAPSQTDIDYLKSNPSVKALFEKRFGSGSADKYVP